MVPLPLFSGLRCDTHHRPHLADGEAIHAARASRCRHNVDVSDLKPAELRSVGGTWSGLLFENPVVGYPLTLTWTFSIDFEEIVREYGSSSPSLTIDWVPAGTAEWTSMAGRRFRGSTFADPIETSVYIFDHHRFDRVDLEVEEQDHDMLRVAAVASGDLDGLGLDQFLARATLRFEGIYVQTPAVGTDRQAAIDLLSRVTTVDGLVPRPRQHNVVFEPHR